MGKWTNDAGAVCTPANGAGGGTCKAPPACGKPCDTPVDCAGAQGGCNICGTDHKCKAPPACGTACNAPADCNGAQGGCNTCGANHTCQTPPACGTACNTPADCTGAQGGCNVCGTDHKCKAPPVCGTACNSPADCTGAQGGCNVCGSNHVCQTPPACGTACNTPADCNGAQGGCNTCIAHTCQSFNPNACTCDGIDYSGLAAGQTTTITSFAKVTGADIPKAQVVSEKFFLTKGTDTTGTIVESSDPIASTIVSQDANKVRYQSQWSFTMLQLVPGATYRIWSQISCQPKAAAYNYVQSNVLGASTGEDTSLFGRIASFFAGLFGVHHAVNVAAQPVPASTPSVVALIPTPGATLGVSTQTANSLQIGSVNPYDVQQKTCDFIIFKNNF